LGGPEIRDIIAGSAENEAQATEAAEKKKNSKLAGDQKPVYNSRLC
jgi:hypothetical protein